MIFVTLVSIVPEKNREAYEEMKRLNVPSGVQVKAIYGLFGRYDALLIHEAANETAAMDFLLSVCKIAGVTDTETFIATSI